MLEESVEIRRKQKADGEPTDLDSSLFHLAWLRQDLGAFDEADAMFRETLDVRRKRYGHDDLRTADAMFHLAWAQHRFDASNETRRAEVKVLLDEVLRIRRAQLGDRHRDVGIALIAKGVALVGQEPLRALPLLTEGTSILERPENADRVSSALRRYFFSAAARKLKRLDEAAALHKRAIDEMVEALGEGHPFSLLLLGDYSELLREKGDLEGEREALRRAVARGRQSLLRHHPAMIEGLTRLAVIEQGRGNLEAAERYYAEALEIARRIRKEDSSRAITNELVKILRKLNREPEARAVEQSGSSESLD